MGKYILNRILRSLLSLVAVMILTIVLIYSLMDRDALVTKQEGFNKNINNDRVTFTYEVWQNYGYVETYSYTNFCRIKYSDPKSEEFQKCIDFIEKAIKIIVRIMIITNIVFIQSVQQENQNGR